MQTPPNAERLRSQATRSAHLYVNMCGRILPVIHAEQTKALYMRRSTVLRFEPQMWRAMVSDGRRQPGELGKAVYRVHPSRRCPSLMRSDAMRGARYIRFATMIVPAVAAVGMLFLAVDSAGQVQWWFLLAMALTVLNGVLMTYTMHLQSAHGSASIVRRLNLVSRCLTWAVLAAVAVMILRLR